jgi:2-polyprenyl-3-methyl-5-hydroxy-6-metoxy-1,4-benzoquinol methylase
VQLYAEQLGYDADFGGLMKSRSMNARRPDTASSIPSRWKGRRSLYRALEKTDWCYEEDKWEHNTVAARIPESASLLDIGCGRGAFLSKVRSPHKTGIELNKSAAAFARARGITVAESLIQDHEGAYDYVTAFQVLEHIADPMPFLRSCLKVLKPGGSLIIAVPNNDAFIRFAELPLNQPPHHVGLWSPQSLAALETLLPMRLESIEEEPLRELDWYQQVMESRYLPRRWQRSLYYLGGQKIVRRFLDENRQTLAAQNSRGQALHRREQGFHLGPHGDCPVYQ